MATSAPVSFPIPSSRPALGWQDRVQRFLLLDRTLGYLFLLPALLVILGVALSGSDWLRKMSEL